MKMQYSAAELAAMRLDGYPATEQNMSKRAASENWRFVEVAARGGKNGTRREYPLNQPALKHLIPQIQDLAVAKFLKEFSHGIKTAAKSGQPDAGIGAGTPADDVEMSAESTPASVTASRPDPTHPMNPVMITPTIGAVVHFYRPQISAEPVPALVCRVWSDRMINLGGFDCDGVTIRATWVTLVQAGDAVPSGAYAAWPAQASISCPTFVVRDEPGERAALAAAVGRVALLGQPLRAESAPPHVSSEGLATGAWKTCRAGIDVFGGLDRPECR